jgi:hypothetical protein
MIGLSLLHKRTKKTPRTGHYFFYLSKPFIHPVLPLCIILQLLGPFWVERSWVCNHLPRNGVGLGNRLIHHNVHKPQVALRGLRCINFVHFSRYPPLQKSGYCTSSTWVTSGYQLKVNEGVHCLQWETQVHEER